MCIWVDKVFWYYIRSKDIYYLWIFIKDKIMYLDRLDRQNRNFFNICMMGKFSVTLVTHFMIVKTNEKIIDKI